jgi:hypothetical protein
MSQEKDFWKSIEAISDQQRQLPSELRQMSGVPKQTFRTDRLPEKPLRRVDEESNE